MGVRRMYRAVALLAVCALVGGCKATRTPAWQAMEIRNESTGPVHVDLHDRNGPAKHIRLMPGSTIVHESVGRSGPSVIALLDEGPKKLNFGPLTSPGRAYL